MEELIEKWGYLAVYFGTLFEGEAVYITSIVLSRIGHLQVWLVAILAFLGGATRDMLIFLIARSGGRRFILNRKKLNYKVEKVSQWLEKRSWWYLSFHRYIYGLSTATIVTLALGKMSLLRFFFLTLLACFVWVVGYGILAYWASDSILNNIDWIKSNILLVFIGIILIIILIRIIMLRLGKLDSE